jgi:hypothetical protein
MGAVKEMVLNVYLYSVRDLLYTKYDLPLHSKSCRPGECTRNEKSWKQEYHALPRCLKYYFCYALVSCAVPYALSLCPVPYTLLWCTGPYALQSLSCHCPSLTQLSAWGVQVEITCQQQTVSEPQWPVQYKFMACHSVMDPYYFSGNQPPCLPRITVCCIF